MAILKLAASVAALTLAAGAAHAGNVLTDNFDSENGGASSLNYTNFANFNVVGGVDLVATPDFGITCAGGGGSCVDLAGTPGPGEIVSKNFYGFTAGQLVTLSFDISGNQRIDETNTLYGAFNFAGNTKVEKYTLGGDGFGSDVVFSKPFTTDFISTGTTTTGENQPFETYTMSFIALQTGSVQVGIGTNDGGDFGPVLDNVNLSISAVPEPASWAMMLVGFGGLGATMRASRRKLATATA
jgi:hypothetical protein